MTATLTEMGELVDVQRDDLGRQINVNVNIYVSACQCCIKPWKRTGELKYSPTYILNFDSVWKRMVSCLSCIACVEMPLVFAVWQAEQALTGEFDAVGKSYFCLCQGRSLAAIQRVA